MELLLLNPQKPFQYFYQNLHSNMELLLLKNKPLQIILDIIFTFQYGATVTESNKEFDAMLTNLHSNMELLLQSKCN